MPVSRIPGRRRLTRPRRGGILVFVGATIVLMVAFGAMAVDYGSFYLAANEMQTVSDASALAGARRLSLSTATTNDGRLADAVAGATGAASQNTLMGAAASIAAGNVQLKVWNDATSTASNPTGSQVPNAVQVLDTAQTTFMIGQVFGSVWGKTAPRVPRGAIAWTANISGATCVRPLGFSMSNLYQMLGLAPRDGPLTQAEVDQFNNLTAAQRTFIANPPQNGNGQPSVAIPPYQPYAGLAYDGTRGVSQYQRELANPNSCQTDANSVDLNDVYDQPSAMTSRFTTDVFTGITTGPPPRPDPLCSFSSVTDQTCTRFGTTELGIRFPVAFGVVPGEFGRSKFEVDMLADVTIRCYVRGTPGNGANAGDPQAGATCNSGTTNPVFNNVHTYSGGTIVAVIEPNLAFKAGKVKYSDTPSISQQLILVR